MNVKKKIFEKIARNRVCNRVLLKLFMRLHNLSYTFISLLVSAKGIHPKHRIMNYHKFFVDNVNKNSIVLDIGCGNGAVAFDVAKKAKQVTAIDTNKENIRFANKNYKRNNLKFINGNALHYKFDNRFDFIILSNVLEHIRDRVDFLKSLHDLSKVILLRVPMLTRDWLTPYKKEHGFEYRLDNTHHIEYTLSTLTDELNKSGFKLIEYSIQFGELWGIVEKI